MILEGGISKSAKRKHINETLEREASNPYTEEYLKNWLKPQYLRDVKHLWKYGRIEKSEHDNLLVDIDKSVNNMIFWNEYNLQEEKKKEIDNSIKQYKKRPIQKKFKDQYDFEKKHQKEERYKQWEKNGGIDLDYQQNQKHQQQQQHQQQNQKHQQNQQNK